MLRVKNTAFLHTILLLRSSNLKVPSSTSSCKVVRPSALSAILNFRYCSFSNRWLTYLVVLAFFGGLGYYAYLTFVPQPKKRSKAPATPAPVGTTTATSPGGYEEEWIPEHHLKKPKQRKGKGPGALTSGDETSGAELSGTEGKKRKTKK